MDSEADEDTVERAPVPIPVDLEADRDADTVIRERQPFADIPLAALIELREPEPLPGAFVAPVENLGSTLPVDYEFTINSSEPVRLDSAAVIGRNPALPRIMQGRPPLLIRVPSPLCEVSNTHLEVRQQGALVIVTDLRTTNGSVVVLPGGDPVRLRQGESLVVMPGTVVQIGDGNVIEILSVQRVRTEEQARA